MRLRSDSPSDPYASIIETFLSTVFPAITPGGTESVIDAVTTAFLASSNVRYGPAPKPEGVVAIRERIRFWVERNEPIAVLSPWGSRKAGHAGLDIAELGALRQLQGLQERVSRVYRPGLAIHLGIEDMGGWYLWADDPQAMEESRTYVADFQRLIRILDMPYITPVVESELIPYAIFERKANEFIEPLAALLMAQEHGDGPQSPSIMDPLTTLQSIGWQGTIPDAQRTFYMEQYAKLYPDKSHHQRLMTLAAYLAQSAARYRVGAKVKDPAWIGKYVQINFPLPVPGVPDAIGAARLYYRTLPAKFARSHMPPWRAKGYVCVDESNTVTPKLMTFNEITKETVTPFKVYLSSDTETVCVSADYVLRGNE